MDKMLSIIIPVYNAEKFLHFSVDSIISQTYTNYELLLVNDGSTDLSLELCKEYAKKDRRIKVFDKRNGGANSARKVGVEVSCGDYIMFLDSDDRLYSDTKSFNHSASI